MTETRPLPAADQLVADVLNSWPETVAVFLHRRMACPGCAMAPFMTVGEAAASYRIAAGDLVADLVRATRGEAPAGPFAPPLPHSVG